VHGTLPIE